MKVVVDASNVAFSVKNKNGQPQMSNIQIGRASCRERV